MHIYRKGTETTSKPPEDSFSGEVRIEGYFRREAPSRLSGAVVRFAPSARTPWKVNPVGQTLIVTDGAGLAQSEGGPIHSIEAGDIVWCEPGKPHWEGAAPGQALAYVAVNEGAVEFIRSVTDEEYAASAEDG